MPEPFEPKDATEHTAALNAAEAAGLNFSTDDFELASRGLVAKHPTGVIEGSWGIDSWDLTAYEFLSGDQCPPSIHPSLWRQAKLNHIDGLFQVDEGLWQVRGYDISVISFIEGESGWIIIDPLTTSNTAKVALDLANHHLGERPVKAVIYTHSHTDHYGGVRGVTTPEAVAAGEVQVIAPVGFLDEVVAESLVAGNAMLRRAFYQFGVFVPPGEKGHVDAGLGKAIVKDQAALIAPTREITTTGEELTIDGVRIVFQNTPNAEAPAEMNFFFPDKGWLCTSEICTHTMHNLIPFRGAKVRDSLAWSKYINEAAQMWGGEARLVFASHHWPRWGNEAVQEFLTRQRDMYRWIHDQTMRLAATGLVANEIAEELEMPPEFLDESHTRGYYGALVHNVKAVYQLYLSWYDGNPAHLWPHPPVAAAERYVEFMGGVDAVLAKARQSYDEGDYRWVAEVVNHVVFAAPDNDEARALQADALEQLGYQSESATWRNAYLTGAMELRGAVPPVREAHRKDTVEVISLEQLVDTIGIRVQSENVGGVSVALAVDLVDSGERGLIGLQNRTIHYIDGATEGTSSLRCRKDSLVDLAIRAITFDQALEIDDFECSDPDQARLIFDNLDTHYTGFNIVTP